MQEITDLMRIKYGISKAPKSLAFKPTDSLHAQWMKTAKWLAKTGLSNGDYGEKDETEAAKHYFANYVREKDAKITVTPVKFSKPVNLFLERQFKLQEGKDKSSALKGHVYFLEQHLGLVNKDVQKLVMIDPTNHSLTQHGRSVSFRGGTPNIVAEELKEQGFSDEQVEDLSFSVFNQDLLIGYDKLQVDAEKEILPKLEGREKDKSEEMLRMLSDVGYRTKRWAHAFTISTELQDAVENGRKMSRAEADQNVQSRFYSDEALKNGWYNPETKRFYFNEKYLREGAVREKERAKTLQPFENYLWNTYDISLTTEAEEAEKSALKKHARFFEEKKNIPPKHRQKMEELSKMLESHFEGVELDEDTDLDKIDKLAPEIKAITEQLPLAENGQKPILRFRKLGTTALGKFTKFNNTIAVDLRDFGNGNVGIQSFLHEYGHYLDQNQNGLPLSLRDDFRQFSLPAQREILRNPEIDRVKEGKYLITPTEIFARGFEKSLAQFGVKGNFIDKMENYDSNPRYNYGDKVNEKQLEYFKSMGIEDLAKKIKQAVEKLDQKEEEKEKKREKRRENALEEKTPQHYEQLSLDLFAEDNIAAEKTIKVAKAEKAEKEYQQDQIDTMNWRKGDMKNRWDEEKLAPLRASESDEDKMELAKHGSEKDLDELVNSTNPDVRYAVAWRGRPKDLEALVSDENMIVRQAVVAKGRDKDLDKLVDDPEKFIREEVSGRKRDKDLDKLVSDKNPFVRAAVARQGRDKDLDKLVNDPDYPVRLGVVKAGRDKDLDKLVSDPEKFVRVQVAQQGRDKDLDKLVGDKDWEVRWTVALQGRDKDLDKLVSDPIPSVRSGVAEAGRDKDLDKLVNDKVGSVRIAVAYAGRDKDLDQLMKDSDEWVKSSAARKVHDKDLENLAEMSKSGLLDQKFLLLKDTGAVAGPKDTDDLVALAKKLPEWREKADTDLDARVKLAAFGRDKDLDKVMVEPDNTWQVRAAVAIHGRSQDLDKLVSDKEALVRSEVAKHGRDKDLDKLVNDSDWGVRRSVASQGRDKDLDRLVSDPEKFVRSEVARQGRDKDLDRLVRDYEEQVRETVAWQGRDKDLDKLVHDSEKSVRQTVARQGRDKDLDRLVKDPEEDVRQAVAEYGRDKDLDVLVSDPSKFVRMDVAYQKRDQDLDKLVNDKTDFVREVVAKIGRDKDLDKLVSDKEADVRAEVAKHGRDKDLDKLVDDPDWYVKGAVASQKRDQDLDKLVNDFDYKVRVKVAQQGRDKDLDKLVGDPEGIVRKNVASQGRDKDLDKLVGDPDWEVRQAVVYERRDKDLDKLARDRNAHVRLAVAKVGRDKDLDRLVKDRADSVREAVAEKGRDKDFEALSKDSNIVVQHEAEVARCRKAARAGLER